ncbi:MAG: hypothetical protein FWD89_01575 [Firmicutes bacterium]|nr:hypothetical protein [Bacillota bacterium]
MTNNILELERASKHKKLMDITVENLKDKDGRNTGHIVVRGIVFKVAKTETERVATFFAVNRPKGKQVLELATKDVIEVKPVRRGMKRLQEIKEELIALFKEIEELSGELDATINKKDKKELQKIINEKWEEIGKTLNDTVEQINLKRTPKEEETFIEGLRETLAQIAQYREDTGNAILLTLKFVSTKNDMVERDVVYTKSSDATSKTTSKIGERVHRFITITSPNEVHFFRVGEKRIVDYKRKGTTITPDEFNELCEQAENNNPNIQGRTAIGRKEPYYGIAGHNEL